MKLHEYDLYVLIHTRNYVPSPHWSVNSSYTYSGKVNVIFSLLLAGKGRTESENPSLVCTNEGRCNPVCSFTVKQGQDPTIPNCSSLNYCSTALSNGCSRTNTQQYLGDEIAKKTPFVCINSHRQSHVR